MKSLQGMLRVWLMPLLLALASGLGLVAALLSSGSVDLIWAVVAGIPLVVLIKIFLAK